jgi:hypothetical protein
MDPRTGKLWEIEHGPLGGDELNQPQPGKNYGWPVITYGREYSGRKINNGLTAKEGMEQPIYYWDPVIAPSGMIFYTGDKFPEWKNNIFVGSLQPGALVRLVLENDRVTKEERYLREAGRVREVEQGPDGLLYLLTDEPDGQLLRVERLRSAAGAVQASVGSTGAAGLGDALPQRGAGAVQADSSMVLADCLLPGKVPKRAIAYLNQFERGAVLGLERGEHARDAAADLSDIIS